MANLVRVGGGSKTSKRKIIFNSKKRIDGFYPLITVSNYGGGTVVSTDEYFGILNNKTGNKYTVIKSGVKFNTESYNKLVVDWITGDVDSEHQYFYSIELTDNDNTDSSGYPSNPVVRMSVNHLNSGARHAMEVDISECHDRNLWFKCLSGDYTNTTTRLTNQLKIYSITLEK